MSTILVVDDNPHLRLLYRDTLEDEGYTVIEAEGGDAALLRLGRQSIDLMILDIRMPGTHGLQLLAMLRTSHPDIPIILCSGIDALFDEYAVWDAGGQVVGLFRKPMDLNALVECVAQALPPSLLASPERPASS